jgi:hypothetical protein
MRIWQKFRSLRDAAAALSAIVAMLVGLTDLHTVSGLWLDVPSRFNPPRDILAQNLALGALLLIFGLLSLRRGTVRALLPLWTFVIGFELAGFLAWAGPLYRANFALEQHVIPAIFLSGVDLLLPGFGFLLALIATLAKPPRAPAAKPATAA